MTVESGIGKSTLAIRFGAAASLGGAAVARVQCFELEQRIAFGMIGALVISLLDQPGAIATAPEALAEIARIVPKVRERFTTLPAPRTIEGEAVRLHFAEGVFALLDAIMEEQPLVLIVDDYPRSDEASLSVLHMLLRRSENNRLMLVLAGRPPEPDEPDQAARIRKAVAYLPLRKLDLAPLSENESEELLRAVLRGAKQQPASPERRAIIRTAGGNPMALELLGQDWIAHPDSPLAILLTAMRSDVPGAALESAGYEQLVDRIIPQLSPRHRIALYLAAILGPRLNDLDCFRIVNLNPAQTMAALSEMVARRLLRQTEKGLEFTNEIVRALIYLKAPEPTRVRLHDGIAKRLLAEVGRGRAVPGLEVAWHCIRAKRTKDAILHLFDGARNSIQHGAPDEAARALASVLRQIDGSAKNKAALLLAEAYQEMGAHGAVLDTIRDIKAMPRLDPIVLEMSEEMEIMAREELGLLSRSDATDLLKQFILQGPKRTTPRARATATLNAARLAAGLRDMDIFAGMRTALDNVCIEGFGYREHTLVLVAKAMTAFHYGDQQTCTESIALARTFLERVGSQDATLASLQIGAGVSAATQGRYAEAVKPLEAAFALSMRLGNDGLLAMAAGNLGMVKYRLGEYESQLHWSLIAQRSRTDGLNWFERVRSTFMWALASASLRLYNQAEEAIGVLRAEIAQSHHPWVAQWGELCMADVLWVLGRHTEALEVAADGIAVGPLTRAISGRYSRWSAMVTSERKKCQRQLAILLDIRKERERLDLIDRAELDCAVARLSEKLGLPGATYRLEAHSTLAALPPACTHQIRSLGML